MTGKYPQERSETTDQTLLNKLSHTVVTDLSLISDEVDIYQRLQFLQKCGLEFKILDPQFCQLKFPLDLLDIDKIRASIPEQIASLISAIERHDILESTNSELLNSASENVHARICLAEYQSAGRGRHGRQWLAPYSSGLCLSFGWQFQTVIKQSQLISLLPAVACIRVLHRIGINNAGAKWPNDVICNGQKLAGILIEISANKSDFQTVIIGLGLNVYNRSEISEQIQQPWTTIDQQLDKLPSRNELAAMLITELFNLIQMVEATEKEGLAEIRDEWRRYDQLINTPVSLINGNQKIKGISRGINDDGSLRVEVNSEMKQYVSGEISLRADE